MPAGLCFPAREAASRPSNAGIIKLPRECLDVRWESDRRRRWSVRSRMALQSSRRPANWTQSLYPLNFSTIFPF
jgi:hypothetical protein